MDKKKSGAISVSSAENGVNINAETKEAVSKPHSGEAAPAAGEETNKEAEFEKLIKGEYRKEFAARVKKIIDRRLKEVKQLKENADKNAKIVDMLSEHYNVEKGNTDELERVISEKMNKKEQGDLKTDVYGNRRENIIRKLAAENSYLRQKQAEDIRRAKIRERISMWKEQAKETAKIYPDFEFEEELKNEAFRSLIGAGVGVKEAYEVVHLDAILADNSKNAEKKVITSIRSKANRPVENGSGSSGGILISSDVSKLTPKERAELAKRASRGEKIEF